VTAVLEIVGASLVLATMMVNESVAVAPATSLAVMTTLCEPTSSLVGVPLRAPAVQVSHDGTVVQARVIVSPESTSLAVVVYEYAASSVAAVTAVLEIVGASLVLVTTIVKVSVSVRPAASATVTVTLCEPTSPLAGVPARVAVLAPAVCVRVSQDTLVDVIVHESLESLSTSEVVMLYEYRASSSTAVPPVLVMLGASLVLATLMVNA
jgi:hypothetical protein